MDSKSDCPNCQQKDALIRQLAERLAACSELLGRAAERSQMGRVFEEEAAELIRVIDAERWSK